ncbi:hypothetical protein N7536_005827 [Penicillium majusculum]|nr:hypothetical protein N7536_005827 [Penicillium majusculum]
MVGGSYAVSVDPSCKKITSEGEITLSFKSQFLGRQCYNGEWRHFIPKSCPIKSEDCGGTEYTVAATPSWPIPSNSAAVIHIDGVPGGGLCLQFLDAHFKNKNIGPISRVQRCSGGGGLPRHGVTLALETSYEDVYRHAHPTGNQSPPQEYSSDQGIQEIPSFTIHRSPFTVHRSPFVIVPGRKSAEKYRHGNTGSHPSIQIGTMGEASSER